MTAINQKLLREVWKNRGQMLSIGSVVAVGIMTVLTIRGAYESLTISQDLYCRESRFGQVWAQLERAPEGLRRRIEGLPGVAAVDTRVTFTATLDVPSLDAPALGRFVSVPENRRPRLSDLHLVSGRYLAPGARDEAIISKRFAVANDYGPGDTLNAIINGAYRDLKIVGTAISPEHIYTVPPGAIYPDDKRYGVIWMSRDALGPAYDMDGAFNEVVLKLAPGANPEHVIALLDRLLGPFGGLGAYAREHQFSHEIIATEIAQLGTMGTAIPAVFLLVAAFLLNIVLGRMIALQRGEIAVLKAFGYSNVEVGLHYLLFAMAAVFIGAVVGIAAGIPLGGAMVTLYGAYFDFPTLTYHLRPNLILIAGGVSTLAAVVGALGAVRRAVSLPPAEAMRPEQPASFRAGVFERLGLGRILPASGRMILRNVERTPMRSLSAAIGVAFSVAILVIGLFMFDGVDYMMDLQFRVAQREDLALTFNRPLSQRVRYELAGLDGVTRVEPFRAVPVRLMAGHRRRETAITGMELGAQLRQIVTTSGAAQPLPPEGLVLSAYLAGQLRLSTGDLVTVEVLEGERLVARVPVAGVVNDFIGVSAYMSMDALARLTRGSRSFSGAFLKVDRGRMAALNARLKSLPAVASVASAEQTLKAFKDQLARGLFIAVFFILGFSAVISLAVIYNGARVSLSERGRELASLRVLGLSRREVAVLLFGEQGLTTAIGIPVGWGLGYLLAAGVASSIQSEAYRIPFIIHPSTFMWAALITIGSAVVSGWLVRRRLDRLNLIEVLKTRE